MSWNSQWFQKIFILWAISCDRILYITSPSNLPLLILYLPVAKIGLGYTGKSNIKTLLSRVRLGCCAAGSDICKGPLHRAYMSSLPLVPSCGELEEQSSHRKLLGGMTKNRGGEEIDCVQKEEYTGAARVQNQFSYHPLIAQGYLLACCSHKRI